MNCLPSWGPFTRHVQFEFFRELRGQTAPEPPAAETGLLPLEVVHHPRARRYILRLQPDGSARVTVPRGGSIRKAHEFAARNQTWLAHARHRLAAKPRVSRAWLVGSSFLFRGENVVIEPLSSPAAPAICFGSEKLQVAELDADLRPAIERHLRQLAARELPTRVLMFAARHNLIVNRVTVRNQRSRWGSCSRRGTISLNWRLIQTPPEVRDYIILHELMHLRQMNHSVRFWREVEQVCPDYQTAERWLKQNSNLLK